LTRVVDVEERATHVVIADLEGADPCIGHVAVCAGHPGARVDALVPHLELGMLCLQDRRSAFGVDPVLEARLVVVVGDLLDLEALRPWIREPLFRVPEVVLHVTLATHERAHLLSRRVPIHVVVMDAL